jgi:hypothetical protein
MSKITKISLENGYMLVYPAICEPAFAFIYRAAKNVHWSETQAAFITPVGERDTMTAYRELRAAASEELGLALTNETEFSGLTSKDRNLLSSH